MRSRSQTVGAGALVAVALIACATPVQTEKGRLVPVDVPGETLARAHAPRRLALVIGIDRFDDPQWRPLRFPEADAASVAAVLRDPERGAFDDVEVLAEGPSRGEIREGLRRLADRSRDERDTVVVYVSSHGTLARDGVGRLRRYLVARDTRAADVPGTGVSMDDLKADFDRIRSRRKVLVLAACHSGAGKSLLPDDIQAELAGVKAARTRTLRRERRAVRERLGRDRARGREARQRHLHALPRRGAAGRRRSERRRRGDRLGSPRL